MFFKTASLPPRRAAALCLSCISKVRLTLFGSWPSLMFLPVSGEWIEQLHLRDIRRLTNVFSVFEDSIAGLESLTCLYLFATLTVTEHQQINTGLCLCLARTSMLLKRMPFPNSYSFFMLAVLWICCAAFNIFLRSGSWLGWNVASSVKSFLLYWVSCPDFIFALGQSLTLLSFCSFSKQKKLQYKCLFRMLTFPPTLMTKPAHYFYH